MDEQKMLDGQVRQWQAEGRWIDRGRWIRDSNGTMEYIPTRREIAAKCKLLRNLDGWRGAAKTVKRITLRCERRVEGRLRITLWDGAIELRDEFGSKQAYASRLLAKATLSGKIRNLLFASGACSECQLNMGTGN